MSVIGVLVAVLAYLFVAGLAGFSYAIREVPYTWRNQVRVLLWPIAIFLEGDRCP